MPATTPNGGARRHLIVAIAMIALLMPMSPAAAHAGGTTCRGLPVTILEGTSGDDVIHGTPGDDVIQAKGGNDEIHGGGGNDTICGGTGDDHIFGEDGNDIIVGGKGNDWLTGGDGDDDLRGNSGDDRLYGNGGTDIVRGSTGSDACGAETRYNCEMKRRWGHDPDDWLDLVEKHFGPLGEEIAVPDLADEAMTVMECESGGEPFIEGPDGNFGRPKGLFQFLDGTWDRWNPSTPGWAGESKFHPEANIATAARLVERSVAQGQHRWWQWSCPYV